MRINNFNFCNKVYSQTKINHLLVDKHIYFKNAMKNHDLSLYVKLIKKVMCILQTGLPSELTFLCNKLNEDDMIVEKIFKKIQEDTEDFILLHSQIYMWYLGVMSGGKILKKFLKKEDHHIFDYTEDDKIKLKAYIEKTMENQCEKKFIQNVNNMYIMIKEYLDSQKN